ncbi:MAG TPA: HEAT repeat domain-containing protein [Gemmataceae bacterium]|nr:HEAT repeat domain-containing protein [Gemmataceae bacterium]
MIIRRIFLVFLTSAFCLNGVRGQNPAADPVESTRQILRATNLDARLREQYLRQEMEQIHGIVELRQALGLQEWRDQEATAGVAMVDQTFRGLLCQRFEQEIRTVLRQGDSTSKTVVLNMLAEQPSGLRDTASKNGLARRFTPDLLMLLQQDDPTLRRHAARTLGLIHPDAVAAVPALAKLLNARQAEDRAAAAEGLANLVRTASKLTTRARDLGGIECSRADLVKAGRMATLCTGRALADSDVEVRRKSADAICQAAEALRLLVQAFENGDELEPAEKFREHVTEERTELLPLIDALKEQSQALTRALADADVEVRLAARRALEDMTHPQLRLVYRGLAGMGPKDRRFTSISLKPANFLGSPDVANDPLIAGMQGTVAALAAGLKDPDAGARRAAIDVLESIGPAAAPAAKALTVALTDPDPFVRWSAARTLGKISPIDTDRTVPALARLLNDPDFDLKLAALTALERFGPEARHVVPELIGATISGDADLRMAAMHCLAAIGGPEGHQAIPALRAALSGDDPRIQAVAAEVLGRFGPAAKQAEPELRAALHKGQPVVQKAAGDALLSILQKAP